MPVALVEVGGVARSGHEYGDRTGIEYEYPCRRHSSYIETGDRFVYQKPGVGYFGCGVIGEVRPSVTEGRLVCDVHVTHFFDNPVPLKEASGRYFEADPTSWKKDVSWGQGVWPLSDERLESILSVAGVPPNTPHVARVGAIYARPETARAVEVYSVEVARALMAQCFGLSVDVMPPSNPGFDMRVGTAASQTRFIEVKGTQAPDPVFFMSDGERRSSARNAGLYTLVVVSGIDLQSKTHASVVVRDGAVEGADFDLQPTQWRGRVLSTRRDSPV